MPFPRALREIPAAILRYLAQQTGTSPQEIAHYQRQGRTAKRQRSEILSFLSIRRFRPEHRQVLLGWLRGEVFPMDYSLQQLLERVGDWFRHNRIEPPGVTQPASAWSAAVASRKAAANA